MNKGFTLFETLLALTIVSFVSVTSIYILFLSLNLRDLTLSTTKTEESLRVFERSFRRAVLGAVSITGDPDSIYLRSQDECWSFEYDGVQKNLKYAMTAQSGCTPNPTPTDLFFPVSTKLESMSFLVYYITTGGRLVKVNGSIRTALPFDVYQTSFSDSFVNLVD
jgi:prepilin-type N-terminal cleavage/methylation domain-containing protein